MPEELKYIWDWYRELWTTERLTYSEFMAWCQAVGVTPRPREARLIMSINRAHVVIANE